MFISKRQGIKARAKVDLEKVLDESQDGGTQYQLRSTDRQGTKEEESMSNLAPSPSSSSSEENGSDRSNDSKAPPPSGSSSSSPSDSNGRSNPPPSPSSRDSGSTSPSGSEDSSSSSPGSASRNPPPSRSSPSPSSEPSPEPPSSSSWNSGKSNSSPPPSPPSDSSRNSGSSNSPSPPSRSPPSPRESEGSSPSPPPPPSSSSNQGPPTWSGGSSSSSSEASPSRSSPSPPQSSNSDQSSSQPSPRNPSSSSSSSPPPPANQSVVFVPVPVSSNSPPGVLPPPGLVAVAPGAAAGNMVSTGFPTSSGASTSSSADVDASSSLASTRPGTSHVAAAIAGAAITGLVFAMVAVFFVMSRRRRRRSDGLVYHNDGSQYMPSGQFGGSNPSGNVYPSPGRFSSYGSPPASGGDGGGYYQSGSMDPMGSKSSFSYEELTSITSNFSRDNVIGEGGFGCVYKGWLADGKCVAVKQLKAGSGQGQREFQAEVEIISRVHHRHLVSLVGYCIAQHHRMLIYEFVPNGTLEHHLHGRGVPVMDWPTRLRIAIGAAKGLAYLHEDCHPRIIHRDIKSANILIDYAFEAQVADFGLAKLSNDTHTHVSTRIMGTFGYLAPEYASSGKLTDRSDVFSFGVVLLELITGRKPVDQTRPMGEESLVEWARPVLVDAIETGNLDELVDARLEGRYNRAEMMVMVEAAAACVRHSAPKRPRMVQVMRALDDDAGGMSDLSNGVKVGQSRVYGSGKHEAAIQQLRLTAFASEEYTGEFDHTSTDSDTQPINRRLG
ncbi:hypothetical protein ACP70R_042827 [Stipagrostis hirtigluma subsp. patula]